MELFRTIFKPYYMPTPVSIPCSTPIPIIYFSCYVSYAPNKVIEYRPPIRGISAPLIFGSPRIHYGLAVLVQPPVPPPGQQSVLSSSSHLHNRGRLVWCDDCADIIYMIGSNGQGGRMSSNSKNGSFSPNTRASVVNDDSSGIC
jgi:hypothetical protein